MQGSNKWAPPRGVLGELVASAVSRAWLLAGKRAEIEAAADSAPRCPSLSEALQGGQVAVIAEVKRASPSKGVINAGLSVREQCAAYTNGGAAAISILTEPSRFSGEISDLREARSATALPLLRKDFIVDELQILEARGAGASAVLLIARALDPVRLGDLFEYALASHISPLVEVRDEAELDRALFLGANIIGVNNRDLETLEIDDAAGSLIPKIPQSCIAVAESGYRTEADVARAAAFGADAVLVGSELSAAQNPAALLSQLASVKRSRNARPN